MRKIEVDYVLDFIRRIFEDVSNVRRVDIDITTDIVDDDNIRDRQVHSLRIEMEDKI